MNDDAIVADVGEDALVDLFVHIFPAPEGTVSIGDDAAVFDPSRDLALFTTDTLVEGVDFDLSYCSAADLGWKTLAVNVSDIAAMGGSPTQAVATLCMPRSVHVSWVEELAEGLARAASKWGIDVVGGDLSRAETISFGVALLGRTDHAVLRSGAEVGDAICVTGSFGGSGGGLALLQANGDATGPLVDRHLRPTPRWLEGQALNKAGASAMIDVSDGLVVDLDRLMRSSGRGCAVDGAAIPIDPALGSDASAFQQALFGGEDLELLFTVDPTRLDDAFRSMSRLSMPATRIGTVSQQERLLDGRPLDELRRSAWDHLRGR